MCGARGLLSQRYLSFISVCGHRVQRGHLFLVAQHNRQSSQQLASHHKPSPVSRHPWDHSRSTGTQHPESPRLVGREAQRATYMQERTRRTHQHPEGARGGGHMTVLRILKVSLSLSHTHTHTHGNANRHALEHPHPPGGETSRFRGTGHWWAQCRGFIHTSLHPGAVPSRKPCCLREPLTQLCCPITEDAQQQGVLGRSGLPQLASARRS